MPYDMSVIDKIINTGKRSRERGGGYDLDFIDQVIAGAPADSPSAPDPENLYPGGSPGWEATKGAARGIISGLPLVGEAVYGSVETSPNSNVAGSTAAKMLPGFTRTLPVVVGGAIAGGPGGAGIAGAAVSAAEIEREKVLNQIRSGQERDYGAAAKEMAQDPWSYAEVALNGLAAGAGTKIAMSLKGLPIAKQVAANMGFDLPTAAVQTAVSLKRQGVSTDDPGYQDAFLKSLAIQAGISLGGTIGGAMYEGRAASRANPDAPLTDVEVMPEIGYDQPGRLPGSPTKQLEYDQPTIEGPQPQIAAQETLRLDYRHNTDGTPISDVPPETPNYPIEPSQRTLDVVPISSEIETPGIPPQGVDAVASGLRSTPQVPDQFADASNMVPSRPEPAAPTEGKPVPPEVLANYPDLVKAQAPVRAAKDAGGSGGYASGIHQKSRDAFESAWNAKDSKEMGDLLHPMNKVLRSEFSTRTGTKLPKTISGTKKVLDEWGSPKPQPESQPPASKTSTDIAPVLPSPVALFRSDWESGKAYLQGKVVRLRSEGKKSGPVAPYNKDLRKLDLDPGGLTRQWGEEQYSAKKASWKAAKQPKDTPLTTLKGLDEVFRSPAKVAEDIKEAAHSTRMATQDEFNAVLAQIDDAVQKAPSMRSEHVEELNQAKKEYGEVPEKFGKRVASKYSTVKFQIPGDGEFEIVNTKETLSSFAKTLEKKKAVFTKPVPKGKQGRFQVSPKTPRFDGRMFSTERDGQGANVPIEAYQKTVKSILGDRADGFKIESADDATLRTRWEEVNNKALPDDSRVNAVVDLGNKTILVNPNGNAASAAHEAGHVLMSLDRAGGKIFSDVERGAIEKRFGAMADKDGTQTAAHAANEEKFMDAVMQAAQKKKIPEGILGKVYKKVFSFVANVGRKLGIKKASVNDMIERMLSGEYANKGDGVAVKGGTKFSVEPKQAEPQTRTDKMNELGRKAAARVFVPFKGVLKAMTEHVPEGLRKAISSMTREEFSQTPEIAAFRKAYNDEGNTSESTRERMLRTILRNGDSPVHRMAANRILMGHPTDINDLPQAFLDSMKVSRQEVREVAQSITRDMQALGLRVRGEWLNADKHWYPNIFGKYLIKSELGKMFSWSGRKVSLSKGELSHQKMRISDRWVILNKRTGKIQQAFDSEAAAHQFLAKQSGRYAVTYKARDDAGKLTRVTEMFETRKQREDFINSIREEGSIRVDPDMKIIGTKDLDRLALLPPMTPEQMRAHGLVEDVTISLRQGFSSAQRLVAKVRFFDSLAKNITDETAWFRTKEQMTYEGHPDFRMVKDLGLRIPDDIDNPAIQHFLSGAVEKSLANDLAGMFGKPGVFWTIVNAIKGNPVERGMRKAVTHLNPFRFIKQIPENELSLYFADSQASLDLKGRTVAVKEFIKWARSGGETDSPTMREFAASGLLETDFLHGQEMSDFYNSIGNSANLESLKLSLTDKIAASKIGGFDRATQKLYHLEDAAYKYQYYSILRKRGISAEEAFRRVDDYMFDWTKAPRFIKAMQIIPFAPSVMWQFSRVLTNKMKHDPVSTMLKLSLTIAAGASLRDMMDKEAGVTEADRQEGSGGFAKFGATDFALPMTDSKGRTLKVSARWLIPFSDVSNFTPTTWKEVRRLGRVVLPMAAQPIATFATQTNRYGTPLVYDNTKNAKSKAAQSKRVLLETASNALPGMFGAYWLSMYQNAEKDERSRQDWWINSIAGPSAGVRGAIRPR